MRNKLFILTIIAIAFLGCKKNDSSASSGGTTKTTLITQQSWKFDNAGLDPNKDGTIDADVSSQVPACLKDNTVSFSSNGAGTVDEGVSKCDIADPQTLPFTWNFTSNETQVNINGNAIAGKGGQYKLITLTNTQLSLSKDTTVPIVGLTTIIVNLKH
jgi:hypothetical protein